MKRFLYSVLSTSPEYGIDPKQPKALLGRMKPDVAEEIMNTWQDVKKPGVVVLVVDLSGSMASPGKLNRAKEGAKRFLDAMAPQTYVGLVTFSDTVHEENLIPVAPLTDNRFRIAEIIDKVRAHGGTALFDAVKRGIELVEGAKVRGDGMRTSGRVKLSDLVRLTTRNEAPITSFEGDEKQRKEHLTAIGLMLSTREPVHIFSIGYGNDADGEVLPELCRLVGKHRQLAQELRVYRGEGGRRLRPSDKTLQELEDLFKRQQAVIQEVVQQIVDLDASLSGLIQEGDAGGIMASAREWNERISERWMALRSMSEDN